MDLAASRAAEPLLGAGADAEARGAASGGDALEAGGAAAESAASAASSSPASRWAAAEAARLRRRAPQLAACAAYLGYFGVVVFRNAAFYRVDTSADVARLPDVGMDALPLVATWWSTAICEACNWIPQAALLGLLLAAAATVDERARKRKLRAVWSAGEPSAPCSATDLLETYLVVLVLGHSLRFATYITTSLPGPSQACLEASFTDARPKTLMEIFVTRIPWRVEGNCGDLLFSGRVFQAAIIWLIFERHGRAVFGWRHKVHIACLIALALDTATLGLFMLLRRNAYTEDIILGLALAPLLYHFVTHKLDFR